MDALGFVNLGASTALLPSHVVQPCIVFRADVPSSDRVSGLKFVAAAAVFAAHPACVVRSHRRRTRPRPVTRQGVALRSNAAAAPAAAAPAAAAPDVELRPLPAFAADEDAERLPFGAPWAPMENRLRFARYANWVAPGHFLFGRYPLTQGACEAEGRYLLRALVDNAKVTTFVSLQGEIPDQKDSKWTRDGVRVGSKYCLSYAGFAQDFAFGRKLNFVYEPFQAKQYKYAVPERLVTALKKRVLEGEVLYIHCMGGRGRSGVVAACLLADLYNISADEALRRVQIGYESRHYDSKSGLVDAPETEAQREIVRRFCDREPPMTLNF